MLRQEGVPTGRCCKVWQRGGVVEIRCCEGKLFQTEGVANGVVAQGKMQRESCARGPRLPNGQMQVRVVLHSITNIKRAHKHPGQNC